MAAPSSSTAAQPAIVPLMSPEEEDQVILARITIDERPLRRIIKKFHNYTSLSHTPIVPVLAGASSASSVDDAREAFLVELASFQLLMKKSVMICEAEARQVEEYHRERQRLDNEHETLKSQIEELKIALEHAQMLRRRKIEYDVVAERVNTLPSREELESTIQALENDMAAIRSEHETQDRTIQGQKSALNGIISQLADLRVMGKEMDTTSVPQSPRGTPALEVDEAPLPEATSVESGLSSMNTEEAEAEVVQESLTDPAPSEGMIEENDIEMGEVEMGEVEEDPKEKSKKKSREELEEGEATDASSELSEPPDD
ncbi:hypothetical protein GALMADRAFT_133276 [Galerina marginata CBS 339.88]|uniref:THO complex subunit 7 homolog n=1 Tax=Galerina marginata (strain CBS 339.88) TaxID=685588 RepID=A0A067TVB2_GALM3|nr:hypothetical protein GALMADRAFT_133276 [Galerina marginata CBS 339.88]